MSTIIKKVSESKTLIKRGQVEIIVDKSTNEVFRSNLSQSEIDAMEDDLLGFDSVSAIDIAANKEGLITDKGTLNALVALVDLLNTSQA